jgi:hypothetical protein
LNLTARVGVLAVEDEVSTEDHGHILPMWGLGGGALAGESESGQAKRLDDFADGSKYESALGERHFGHRCWIADAERQPTTWAQHSSGEHRRRDFDPVHNAARSDLVEKQGQSRTATEADLGHGVTRPNLHGLDGGEDDGSVATVEGSPDNSAYQARGSTKLPRHAHEDALPNRHTAT